MLLPKTGLILLCLLLSACVTVLDATTEKPIQLDPGKRTFGGVIDDKKLSTIVAVNLKKADPRLDEARIVVHAYNAVILLTGVVPTAELRAIADDTARRVNKVRQVYNELSIGPSSTFLSRASDKWLESKISGALLINTNIDSSRTKIVVENNVVYLMGLLTPNQVENITDVIKGVRGVSKIVRAVEYIDGPLAPASTVYQQGAPEAQNSPTPPPPPAPATDGEYIPEQKTTTEYISTPPSY